MKASPYVPSSQDTFAPFAPAAAFGVSLVLHVAFAVAPWFDFGRGSFSLPEMIASRGDVAVLIERVPPRATPAERAPVRRVEREVSREAVLPVERAAPEPTERELDPPQIERATAEGERVEPPREPVAPTVRDAVPIEAVSGVRAAQLIEGSGKPEYPGACRSGAHRRGGCEGRGVYELEIDERGRVVSARTVTSAGCSHLDEAALKFFADQARFAPSEVDGRPAAWSGLCPTKFMLDDPDAEARR